jgi:hypothetical protein
VWQHFICEGLGIIYKLQLTWYQHGQEEIINAPKTIERLEEISNLRNIQRRMENEDDEDNDRIRISDQSISLNDFDVHNIDEPVSNLIPDLIFDDVEILA